MPASSTRLSGAPVLSPAPTHAPSPATEPAPGARATNGAGRVDDSATAPRRQPPSVRARRVTPTGAALCVAAAAWMLVLYRPWESAPFSIIDFSEFLPLLTRHASFTDRLYAVLTYYASQGRLNLLSYVGVVVKWSVLGDRPVAWQLVRAFQMLGIFAAAVAALRELGFRWRPTACGATIFVSSLAVLSAWTRLTMGEPLGVCFVMTATLVALRYQRTTRWRASALAIVASLLCAMFAKEMLAFTIPFVLLIAWLYEGDGCWRAVPERSARNVELLLGASLAVVVGGVVVVRTLLHARIGSFGSSYGAAGVSLVSFVRALGFFVLPFSNGAAAGPENLLYVAVVGAGFYTSWKRRTLRAAAWLTAATLPVAAAVAYLPWGGRLLEFYALPCLMGGAIWLALAVEALDDARPWAGTIAGVACALMLASSSRVAYSEARRSVAERQVDGAIARMLASIPADYPTVVAVRPEILNRVPAQQWMMHGPTLSRYAAAVSGHRVPLAVELTCAEAEALLRVSKPVVLNFGSGCALDERVVGVRAPVDYWQGLHHERGALGADVVWPFHGASAAAGVTPGR